jgi:hypothetical protein
LSAKAPALVDEVMWQQAHDVPRHNLTLPTHGTQDSLLRDLMHCAHCGRNYATGDNAIGTKERVRYYRSTKAPSRASVKVTPGTMAAC